MSKMGFNIAAHALVPNYGESLSQGFKDGVGVSNSLLEMYVKKKAIERQQKGDELAQQAFTQMQGGNLAGVYPQAQGQPQQQPGLGMIDPATFAQLSSVNPQVANSLMAYHKMMQPPEITPTPDMKNALALGLKPGTPEYNKYMRDATLNPNTQVNINNTEDFRQKASEDRRAKLIDSVYEQSQTSQGTLTQAQILKDNLDNLVETGGATGNFSPIIEAFNNIGSQMGLNINLDNAASLTQIEAASNKLAVPLTKQLGVNPTDKDFEIIKSTVARAGTSMQANFALVDALGQISERNIAEEQLVAGLDERGASDADIRRELIKFRKENAISVAKPIPSDPNKLKVGDRYLTPRGIVIFDGKGFGAQ